MSNTPNQRQPASYTVWERLEPVTRDYDLTGTLRAEVRDPAWLLARQWQMGEFQGNDGGSPVAVDLEYVQETLSSVDLGGQTNIDYDDSSPPLEPLVERERVLTDESTPPNYRIRVEAGLNFLSRLRGQYDEHQQGPQKQPVPTDFPATVRDPGGGEPIELRVDMQDAHLDEEARRFARIAGGKQSLDGYGIYRALDEHVPGIDSQSPDWGSADHAELPRPESASGKPLAAFKDAAKQYYDWYVDLYDEPDDDTGEAWDEDRLEYTFESTTSTGGTSTTLSVEGYDGDRLDWDDFSVSGTTTGNPDTESPVKPPTPTRLTFNGMPKPRYWELEDADVDFTQLSAAPEDLSWLTMVEIALTAGNKWFMLPITAPYGSLTRITTFEVADTFHEGDVEQASDTTTVTPSAPTDNAATSGGRQENWNAYLYDLPGRDEPGLWLPPVLGSSLESEPVEQVRFTRDETANLVFAIENLVEGPLGDPLNREEFDRPALEVSTINPSESPDQEYVELRNPGDDDLDIGGWTVEIKVTTGEGPLDFHGNSLPGGSYQQIYQFTDVTVDPGSAVRLFTGGTPAHDTPDKLHIGAEKPLWNRGDRLTTYRVRRPAPDGSGNETVLANPITPPDSSLPRYRLASDVPAHWFPMQATDTGPDDYILEVALLMDAGTLEDTINKYPRPMGQVLTPHASVYDEEVTDAGTTVERTYGLTLDADGQARCWSGRTVTVGGGESSSDLRFDFLDESSAGGGAE